MIILGVGLAIGLAGKDDFLGNFVNLMLLLLCVLIPWTAVNLVDYYLIRHGDVRHRRSSEPDGGIYGRINVAAVGCYVLGILVQIPFLSNALYTGPIATSLGGVDISWIVGLAVICPLYYFWARATHAATRADRSEPVTHPGGGRVSERSRRRTGRHSPRSSRSRPQAWIGGLVPAAPVPRARDGRPGDRPGARRRRRVRRRRRRPRGRAGARAFEAGHWSRRAPAGAGGRAPRGWSGLIEENLDELALLDSLDAGKRIADTTTIDVPGSAAILRWYAESLDKVYGEVAPTGPGDLAVVTREPLGVVAAVVPWNYPLEMAIWKLAPALAAGNSVVLKPAEESPLSALRLAELAAEAGLPDGVLSVVPGAGPVVGRGARPPPRRRRGHLHRLDRRRASCSRRTPGESNMKQVWLEAGGKSAVVVLDDVRDLDAVADGVVRRHLHQCRARSARPPRVSWCRQVSPTTLVERVVAAGRRDRGRRPARARPPRWGPWSVSARRRVCSR